MKDMTPPAATARLQLPFFLYRWGARASTKSPSCRESLQGTRTVTPARRGSTRGWHRRGGAVAAILCRGCRRCDAQRPREPGRGRWPRVVRLQVWERVSVTRTCAFLSCNSLMEASGLNLMQDDCVLMGRCLFSSCCLMSTQGIKCIQRIIFHFLVF